MSSLERAIAIATEAHAGQVDKAGQPYILHPLRVMMAMETDEERMVAAMHDLFEDCPGWCPSKGKGPVRPEEFDAWYGALPPDDQARSHRWLTDAAKRHFRGRRGLKAFIDAVTDGRPRGRRRKTPP